jgi:hypothetical protein
VPQGPDPYARFQPLSELWRRQAFSDARYEVRAWVASAVDVGDQPVEVGALHVLDGLEALQELRVGTEREIDQWVKLGQLIGVPMAQMARPLGISRQALEKRLRARNVGRPAWWDSQEES